MKIFPSNQFSALPLTSASILDQTEIDSDENRLVENSKEKENKIEKFQNPSFKNYKTPTLIQAPTPAPT